MGQRFESDRPSIAEIRALRQPRRKTVWVALDGDLLARIDDLERDVRVAERDDERETRQPVAPRLRVELEQARADAEDAAVPFTFTEIPRKQYRALIDAHPSTDKTLRWHEETFAPALIAACCAEPAMTLDDAQGVWDEWGHGLAMVLFGTAIAVCEEPSKVPFSVTATERTNGSHPSSISASATAAPSDTTSS